MQDWQRGPLRLQSISAADKWIPSCYSSRASSNRIRALLLQLPHLACSLTQLIAFTSKNSGQSLQDSARLQVGAMINGPLPLGSHLEAIGSLLSSWQVSVAANVVPANCCALEKPDVACYFLALTNCY